MLDQCVSGGGDDGSSETLGHFGRIFWNSDKVYFDPWGTNPSTLNLCGRKAKTMFAGSAPNTSTSYTIGPESRQPQDYMQNLNFSKSLDPIKAWNCRQTGIAAFRSSQTTSLNETPRSIGKGFRLGFWVLRYSILRYWLYYRRACYRLVKAA